MTTKFVNWGGVLLLSVVLTTTSVSAAVTDNTYSVVGSPQDLQTVYTTQPEEESTIFGLIGNMWYQMKGLLSALASKNDIRAEFDALNARIDKQAEIIEELNYQAQISNSQLMLELYDSYVASGVTSLAAWAATDDLKLALANSSVLINSTRSGHALTYLVDSGHSIREYLNTLEGYTGPIDDSFSLFLTDYDALVALWQSSKGVNVLSYKPVVEKLANASYATVVTDTYSTNATPFTLSNALVFYVNHKCASSGSSWSAEATSFLNRCTGANETHNASSSGAYVANPNVLVQNLRSSLGSVRWGGVTYYAKLSITYIPLP